MTEEHDKERIVERLLSLYERLEEEGTDPEGYGTSRRMSGIERM